MFTFQTFEKNTFKDLQPPEKSGLQYKCLVLILKIVYECKVSNKTNNKVKKEELITLFRDDSFYCTVNSQFFGMKKCHMLHGTFGNQCNLSHVLIAKVLFDK